VTGVLLSVNVGQIQYPEWLPAGTAIDKRPVSGQVAVAELGLAGDRHAYQADHGGIFQALYAYAQEDADWWAAELGRPLWPGAFGENLTVAGVPASGAVSGERWRVGSVLLQVTVPRIPCRTFAGFWDVPQLVKRFTAAGRPGAYLRVLEPGVVEAGAPVEVLDRPGHGVTVADLMRARSGDRSLVPRILQIEGLPPGWQDWLGSVAAVKTAG
jgi:MOSC domain-containing protein YiiM